MFSPQHHNHWSKKYVDNEKLLHVLELMTTQDVKKPNVHHDVKVHIRIKGQKKSSEQH
jgi:hypothetical protein